jgi:hypothetical protein
MNGLPWENHRCQKPGEDEIVFYTAHTNLGCYEVHKESNGKWYPDLNCVNLHYDRTPCETEDEAKTHCQDHYDLEAGRKINQLKKHLSYPLTSL